MSKKNEKKLRKSVDFYLFIAYNISCVEAIEKNKKTEAETNSKKPF